MPFKKVKSISEIENVEEYDVKWVANYFGVHHQTIRRWLDRGWIECICDYDDHGNRFNIRFTPQQIANRKYRRKNG